MERSRRMLQRYRNERREIVRQIVGKHYSDESTRERVPVNLLAMYVDIVSRTLIAKNPRVMLSTFKRQFKPQVAIEESWINEELVRMNLADTEHRVVVDAMAGIGIAKVALATPSDSATLAWGVRAGEVFASPVDLDDFVVDPSANRFDEVSFIGHRYRVPLDTIKDSKLYTKARKNLTASPPREFNEFGDQRISALGGGRSIANDEDFEDMVDLWEVYLPRHRLIVTLADDYLSGPDDVDEEGLRMQPYIGPYCGPYHILGFGVVPGNLMPRAPLQNLVDMHMVVNEGYRKVMRKLSNLKEVTTYRAQNEEDAARLNRASDGDTVGLSDPTAVNAVVMNGSALQQVWAVTDSLRNVFDFIAGNLSLMGGLAPQSKTATQDTMLQQQSMKMLADMQDRVLTHVSQVVKSILWHHHQNPRRVMTSSYKLEGTGYEVPLELYPARAYGYAGPNAMHRDHNFEDMGLKIDPYSLKHQTPEQRAADLDQMVMGIVAPMMPILQNQGVAFDANAYLKKRGQYLDMPDVEDILTIREPPGEASGTVGNHERTLSPQTSREYTRRNVPQGEPNDENMDMMEMPEE